jgi:hypothetical protein
MCVNTQCGIIMLDYIVRKRINLEHIEPVYAFRIGFVFVIHNALQ